MTFRRRLVLAFAYLLVLIVVALAIPLGVSVDRRAKDAFYARVSAQGQVIATSLGGSGKLDGDLPGLRQKVRVYGSNIDARVIVTDGSDKALLLADSDDAQAPPKTPTTRPAGPRSRPRSPASRCGWCATASTWAVTSSSWPTPC